MTFNTHPALARALAARGYDTATAVQLAVLQDEAAGRDLVVSAQTGSGKTVAFGMAFAGRILGEEERFAAASAPLALVVAPTRELAMQVQRELVWLYAETGARVATCVGGMDPRAEARALAAGAHIVVGTPGRLRDHLERGRLDLTQLRSVVLDEADEMLDLGFREDLEFILEATPAERQTLLFSATMPPAIVQLAGRYQSNAFRIQTVRRNEQHADIEYQAIRVASHDVENAVVNVLRFHDAPAAIVFCSTREAVKRMNARLADRGFSAVALSGELSQEERTHALQAIRDGRARLLVATDVAARGLDLPDLSLVIHADLPNNHDTLLHRSGRTGRAGRKGLCVLIVPFNRRKKADTLLAAARLRAAWTPAPTAEEIRQRDQERFLSGPAFDEPPADEDVALARVLQEARSPHQIAVALARMYRSSMPAAEDLTPDAGPPRRDDMRRFERRPEGDAPRPQRTFERRPESDAPRPQRRFGNTDGADMVWFRINIGQERNADPRWLLPLICRAGGISKAEIGAIRVSETESRFQIAKEAAEAFEHQVRTSPSKEGAITRSEAPAASARPATSEQRPPRQTPSRAPSQLGAARVPQANATSHGQSDRVETVREPTEEVAAAPSPAPVSKEGAETRAPSSDRQHSEPRQRPEQRERPAGFERKGPPPDRERRADRGDRPERTDSRERPAWKGKSDWKGKDGFKGKSDFKPKGDWKAKGDFKPKSDWKDKGESKPKGDWKAKGDFKPKSDWKDKGESKPKADWKAKGDFKPKGAWKAKSESKPEWKPRPPRADDRPLRPEGAAGAAGASYPAGQAGFGPRKKPHRKGQGAPFRNGQGSGERSPDRSRDRGASFSGDRPRPPSKYAHKKKFREGPPKS